MLRWTEGYTAPSQGGGGGESLVGELYDRFFGFAENVFREMHRKQRFTFDDQKYVALLLLEERVLRCAAPPDDRWTHVLVDEFQDISPLDLRLVKAIAERSGAALTIVGDDDQAIYEWRGGAPTYLLEPEREFGREFKTFVLERNYRCPRNLVAAADRLIRHNRNRHPKRMQAHNKSNAEIVPLESPDSAVSVRDVMKEVERFRRDSSTGDRMALLSRKKAQLVPYQILLADADIPFNAADDLKIFLSSAFDKLKRVLEIRARCDAEEITARQVVEDTIHVCRQVRPGDRDRRTIEQFKQELRRVQPSGFAEACEAVRALQRGFDLEADYAGALSSMFAAKTGEEAIRVIRSRFEALHQDFGRGATDIFFQDPPFFYLGAVAKRFGSDFHAFLRTLDRAKESAATHEGEELAADRSQLHDKPIELATALRAKGKQFHTVVILDANAGVWPSRLAETDMEKEAERRLFYVAMTRAQRKLIVSWYKVDAEAKPTAPSPYIAEAALGGTPSSSVRATATPGQSLPLNVKEPCHPAPIGPARTAPSREEGRRLKEREPRRARRRSDTPASAPRIRSRPPIVITPGSGESLGDQALARLIGRGESEFVEFNSTLRTNMHTGRPDRRIELAVLKTLAGFLNTDGGTLFVGVEDGGSVRGLEADGFESEDKLRLHLVNLVKSRMSAQTTTAIRLRFQDHQGCRILVVQCDRSSSAVWIKDVGRARFFVRKGAATTELRASEVVTYLSSRG